ncbi:MAG: Serine/threonine protein kinaserelated protein [Planctomycetaceae bacterium]|nr:Serine/threonine protein kinaserelated protein [Planctomycetaceae bacterium]
MNPTQIGPYEVLSKIGSGGMGSVYLGKHKDTGEELAIKVLPASMANEEGFVKRFNREIESMKKLSNPHIVKLHENGVDNGTYYYSMEYVEGETLTQLLRRERRLPWLEAINIGIQICHALKAAHDAGIIHRDLKPSNLLIASDGMVKLTDFGIAQVFAAERLTVTDGIVGTAEFMSPEQAEGKRASKQSDLYSLGAVLYAMVCGKPPFTAETMMAVLQKHRFGQFDSPRRVNPEIPSWFEEVIVQLLNKDPAKRLPDAYVVGRRLEQVRNKMEFYESSTEADNVSAGSATIAADDPDHHSVVGPGPATLMKDLVRHELESEGGYPFLNQILNSSWFLVAMLLLIVLGGFLWFHDWSPSPEQRIQLGEAIMAQPPGDDWLKARDEYFKPLVDIDGGKWNEQVVPYLSQIDQFVELDKLKRDIRKNRGKRGSETNLAADEPRRLLVWALNQKEAGDLVHAQKTVQAVKALLEGDPEQTRLYDLCQQLAREMQRDETAADEWLKSAVERANKLTADKKTSAARAIWESIIQLYGEDPAAAKYVEQAQQALNQKAKSHP